MKWQVTLRRRNPRVALFKKEYQARLAAQKLARATGQPYAVIDAMQARSRPMLLAGMDDYAPELKLTGNAEKDDFLIENYYRVHGRAFEVLPVSDIPKMSPKKMGHIIQIFGKSKTPSPTDTTVVFQKPNPKRKRLRRRR